MLAGAVEPWLPVSVPEITALPVPDPVPLEPLDGVVGEFDEQAATIARARQTANAEIAEREIAGMA